MEPSKRMRNLRVVCLPVERGVRKSTPARCDHRSQRRYACHLATKLLHLPNQNGLCTYRIGYHLPHSTPVWCDHCSQKQYACHRTTRVLHPRSQNGLCTYKVGCRQLHSTPVRCDHCSQKRYTCYLATRSLLPRDWNDLCRYKGGFLLKLYGYWLVLHAHRSAPCAYRLV